MNFLLSGYYGFGNAGDEAVLAAILEALSSRRPDASFTVTSGDPLQTEACFNSTSTRVHAIGRQAPRALVSGIRSCDIFISGGGSLLQDVTSLRNVVYYTSLIRFAAWARKPVMVYAQGVGPLRRRVSQKLARAAVQLAKAVTVRDQASQALLRDIGVRSKIEVTADPVWALTPDISTERVAPRAGGQRTWAASLRPWQGYEYDPALSPTIANSLRGAAQQGGAAYRFVPMQDGIDAPAMQHLLRPPVEGSGDTLIRTAGLHPRQIMALCGGCDAMIGMRLHALIFAAVQGVPCVAVDYDPKVAALAQIIGAPLLNDLRSSDTAAIGEAVAAARPMDPARLVALREAATRNAVLAVQL